MERATWARPCSLLDHHPGPWKDNDNPRASLDVPCVTSNCDGGGGALWASGAYPRGGQSGSSGSVSASDGSSFSGSDGSGSAGSGCAVGKGGSSASVSGSAAYSVANLAVNS